MISGGRSVESLKLNPTLISAETEKVPRAGAWESLGRNLVVWVLITIGYMLSFSVDENDSLDTVRWMQAGAIRAVGFFEFRHLIQRLLPFWLWRFLFAIHFHISAKHLLNLWDFFSAAASVLLLYRVLLEISKSRPLSFAGSFAYAIAHCVWIYVGSGRLYSTSLLFVFAAYYLVLRLDEIDDELRCWAAVFGAATMIAFASMFWLVHAFNAVGVGLLILGNTSQRRFTRRLCYFTIYSLTGIAVTLAVGVSCLRYAQITLTLDAVTKWMANTGTQPMQFDQLSLMKASYGQAHGILVMYQLPYVINGLMLNDPALVRSASLPWQVGKFIFVWILLLLVYLYPLRVFWGAPRSSKVLIAALYAPLAINMYFAVGWLGSDVQRFMPTLLSQVALGVISVKDLLARSSDRRPLAVALAICLVFIAADNLYESLLPSQRRYMVLAEEMKNIRSAVRSGDLAINFGRDITITYSTMHHLYGGIKPLNLTNDETLWQFDSPNWDQAFNLLIRQTGERGRRIFVMDRIALGSNPPQAEWSERQHPHPNHKELAEFFQTRFCLLPAFSIEGSLYFQVLPRTATCPTHYMFRAPEVRR